MKHKVMIVDDSVMMRVVIRSYVSTMPEFEAVVFPENGKKALDALDKFPDLSVILLDLEMPEMDGFQFLERARKLTSAKIIILSSLVCGDSVYAEENIAKALKLGADAILSKPSGTVSLDLADERGATLTETMRKLVGLE